VCICVRNVYIRFVVLAAPSSHIFDRCVYCLEIGQIGLKIDTHNEKFFWDEGLGECKTLSVGRAKRFHLIFHSKNR